MSMKNRRRLLETLFSVLPLFVFEHGDAGLSNGTQYDKSLSYVDGTVFEEGVIKVEKDYRSIAEEYEAGYIDIGGIDFGPYKTLFIECRTNVQDYDENKPFFYVGYGKKNGAYHTSYTEYEYAPSGFGVISFDISDISGTDHFIKGTSYNTGSAHLEIKNIWLE